MNSVVLGQAKPLREPQAPDRRGALADHRALRPARGAAGEQHVVNVLGLGDLRRRLGRSRGEQRLVVEKALGLFERDPVLEERGAVAQRSDRGRKRAGRRSAAKAARSRGNAAALPDAA